jgi:hypothetical protein
MSFVQCIQKGQLVNKNGEKVTIEEAEMIEYDGKLLELDENLYNNYSVKDVYVAYLYRDMDYTQYLLKATELEVQPVTANDRPELLKLFESRVLERPEWDTPIAYVKDPNFYMSTSDLNFIPLLDAVEKAIKSSSMPKVRPIIIVPSDLEALLHTQNIKEFIEKGTINRQKYRQKEVTDHVVLPKQYHIVHHVKIVPKNLCHSLRPADWNRVIAILIEGQPWDFQNIPTDVVPRALVCFFGFQRPALKYPGTKVYLVDQRLTHQDALCHRTFFQDLQQLVISKKQEFAQ